MTPRRGITALVSLTLLLAACGDDDETATTTDAPSAAPSVDDAAAADTTTAANDEDTSAPTSTAGDDEDSDHDGSDDDDGTSSTIPDLSELTIPADVDLTDQCEAIANSYADAVTDPNAFGNLRNAFQDLRDVAPDEIDADIDVVLEVYDELADRVEDGVDPATALGDPEILQMMSTPEFNASATRIIDFVEPYCTEGES